MKKCRHLFIVLSILTIASGVLYGLFGIEKEAEAATEFLVSELQPGQDIKKGDTIRMDNPEFDVNGNIKLWQVIIRGDNYCRWEKYGNYTWTFNPSDNYKYKFAKFLTADEVNNEYNGVCADTTLPSVDDSNAVFLLIENPFYLETMPTDQEIDYGDTAVFNVGINPIYNDVDLNYQWYVLPEKLDATWGNGFISGPDSSAYSTGESGSIDFRFKDLKVGDDLSFRYIITGSNPAWSCTNLPTDSVMTYAIKLNDNLVMNDFTCDQEDLLMSYTIMDTDIPAGKNSIDNALIQISYRNFSGRSIILDIDSNSEKEIPGATSPQLKLDKSSPYYYDGAEFFVKVKDLLSGEEDTSWRDNNFNTRGARLKINSIELTAPNTGKHKR